MILPLAAAAGSGLASVLAWERVTTAPMATITPQATTTNPSLMKPPGLIGTKDTRRVKLPASFASNRLHQGLMPSGGLIHQRRICAGWAGSLPSHRGLREGGDGSPLALSECVGAFDSRAASRSVRWTASRPIPPLQRPAMSSRLGTSDHTRTEEKP